MKSLVLALAIASISLANATVAHAEGTIDQYEIQSGDTLWDIADAKLGSPWCWTLIASIPRNDIDYRGLILVGDTIELPSVEDCGAIASPLKVEAPLVDKSVLEIFPSNLEYLKGYTLNNHIERKYVHAAPLKSHSEYDHKKSKHSSLYRERDGDTWYVVLNGVRGQTWDYVDHVLKNDATGSIFYRARDIRGEWHVVKNEVATKLSFEPKELYLNQAIDDVFAFSPAFTSYQENPETHLYSSIEEWTIPVKAVPVAIDPDGRVLFREESKVLVQTVASDGTAMNICRSSTCSFDDTYWMNGKRIATASRRMVPLFSEKDPAAKLPFWFDGEGTEQTYKFYGAFGRPWFDAAGNLVFYVVRDSLLTKETYGPFAS